MPALIMIISVSKQNISPWSLLKYKFYLSVRNKDLLSTNVIVAVEMLLLLHVSDSNLTLHNMVVCWAEEKFHI